MRFGPGVHFSASDVREGARERGRKRDRQRARAMERERGRERVCVCVYLCECEREKERERERTHYQGLSFLSKGQSAVLKRRAFDQR